MACVRARLPAELPVVDREKLDGFAPAIATVAALSLTGAIVALGLPGRRLAVEPVSAVLIPHEAEAVGALRLPGGDRPVDSVRADAVPAFGGEGGGLTMFS